MKRVLVSGGSSEIGAAICRQLARSDWQVIVHAHTHAERAAALAEEIGGRSLCFDLRDATAAAAAPDRRPTHRPRPPISPAAAAARAARVCACTMP